MSTENLSESKAPLDDLTPFVVEKSRGQRCKWRYDSSWHTEAMAEKQAGTLLKLGWERTRWRPAGMAR